MEKEKALAIARELLEGQPKLDVVFICSDGQGFDNQHSAINNEKEIRGKRTLTDDELPVSFSRSQVYSDESASSDEPAKETAKAVIEKIKSATTADEVDALISGDDRKSVLDAAESKKKQLASAEGDNKQ